MSWEMVILAGFFATVVVGVVLAGCWLQQRLPAGGQSAEESLSSGAGLMGAPSASMRGLMARVFHLMGETVGPVRGDRESLRKRLLSAGYRWPGTVPVFYGIRCATALGLAALVGWTILLAKEDFTQPVIPALCAAGFGFLLPDRVLSSLIRARARRIRSALPAAVDLLVLGVEAGQSLDSAVHDSARALENVYPDLAGEFIFCHLEMRAGKGRQEALHHLAERSPEPELSKLANLLLDSDRFGVSLGPALRTHARHLRIRLRQQAQEAARKLGVKLVFPVFFLIFPCVLLVTLGPAYLQLRKNLENMLNGL